MRLDAIKPGNTLPDDINVVIEVPVGGEPIKYEMERRPARSSSIAFSTRRCAIPGTTASFPQRWEVTAIRLTFSSANARDHSGRRHQLPARRRSGDGG